jgi:protein subunit release factor B
MKLFETRFISWKSNSIFGMRTLSAGTSLPRRPIEILESDIEEKFVKGSGAGGQKSMTFKR